MIYIVLSREKSVLQTQIVSFVDKTIRQNNFCYDFIIVENQHIIESKFSHIENEKDIVLWHPIVANNNLEFVKTFNNSIIIIEKPSLYIQKISKFNPINENLVINNGLFLIYINPDNVDITNDDWKLVVQEDMYLITHEKLIELIKADETNFKEEEIIQENIFESITNQMKNQINLT